MMSEKLEIFLMVMAVISSFWIMSDSIKLTKYIKICKDLEHKKPIKDIKKTLPKEVLRFLKKNKTPDYFFKMKNFWKIITILAMLVFYIPPMFIFSYLILSSEISIDFLYIVVLIAVSYLTYINSMKNSVFYKLLYLLSKDKFLKDLFIDLKKTVTKG